MKHSHSSVYKEEFMMNMKAKKSQENKLSLGIKRERETTDCLFSKVNTSRLRSRENKIERKKSERPNKKRAGYDVKQLGQEERNRLNE